MRYVLIAEDDPDIARILSEGIGERLSVVALPGLSGLDVFDLVRNDDSFRGIPILFLTAIPEKARTALAPAGIQCVMGKPFDVDELVRTVDEMTRAEAQKTRSAEAAA